MSVNATACAPKVIEGPEREASGWSIPLGTASRAPSADERVPAEPSLRWRANVKRGASGPPALGAQVLAVATLDRALTVLEWTTGETVWRRGLTAPASGPPLMLGDRVYAASTGRQGRVHAFGLRRGQRLWDARVGSIVPPIAASPSLVFVAVESGLVRAFDSHRGRQQWSRRLAGVVRLGPVDLDGSLFVATDDSLYLLAPADGRIRTSAPAPATVIAPPAWRNDTLIIASPDGLVAGLDRATLDTLWVVRTDDDPVFGGVAVARDTVFAVTLGGFLWQVPLATPDQARRFPLGVTVRAPPAPTAEGVLVATTAGEVLLVRGGITERRARVDGPVEHAPIVRDGVLLVIDGKGRVMTWQ